jgi:hypothetical protein
VRINEKVLERKVTAPIQKTEINGRGGSAALTMRHPLYPQKLTLNFAKQVAVAQSL